MRLPNTKFGGMSQVTNAAVEKSTEEYFRIAQQRVMELSLLQEVIDFCVDGYGAWKDSVLMGAGAYLKIGNFPAEIVVAKEYVKGAVYQYLTGIPFSKETEYDEWHKEICLTLSDNTQYFQEYSAYRQTSGDKFKNKNGFTVGNAQKFLNMVMKDVYACLVHNPVLLPNFDAYFRYCHMPLDSYILRFVDDVRKRENMPKVARRWTWSNLTSYDLYMKEQEDIRRFVTTGQSDATVLQTEFVVWPLYR